MSQDVTSMDVDKAISAMDMITECANGQRPWPDIYDVATDLTGDKFKQDFEKADEAAAANTQDWHLRMKAAYFYALARDHRNACADAPRFHYGRGVQSWLFRLYFGGTFTITATVGDA